MSITNDEVGNDRLIAIDKREYERLQGVEKAWSAVYAALAAHNPQCFQRPLTGLECAVREIERLQFMAGCYKAVKDALAAEGAPVPDITIERDCFNCGGDGYTIEPRKVCGREDFRCPACQGTGKIRTTHKQAVVREIERGRSPTPIWNIFLFDRQTGVYLESPDKRSKDHEALLRLAQRINEGA